jgi:hypothetical protein
LAHVKGHAGFKGFLVCFEKFDGNSEAKNQEHKEAKNSALRLQMAFLAQEEEEDEDEQVA